jgi:hypothetical protein
MIVHDLEKVVEDLKSKRRDLEGNFFSLDDMNPKEMPMAIYNYVIKNLSEIVDKERGM